MLLLHCYLFVDVSFNVHSAENLIALMIHTNYEVHNPHEVLAIYVFGMAKLHLMLLFQLCK